MVNRGACRTKCRSEKKREKRFWVWVDEFWNYRGFHFWWSDLTRNCRFSTGSLDLTSNSQFSAVFFNHFLLFWKTRQLIFPTKISMDIHRKGRLYCSFNSPILPRLFLFSLCSSTYLNHLFTDIDFLIFSLLHRMPVLHGNVWLDIRSSRCTIYKAYTH